MYDLIVKRKLSDVIVENRQNPKLSDIEAKVYTRSYFN